MKRSPLSPLSALSCLAALLLFQPAAALARPAGSGSFFHPPKVADLSTLGDLSLLAEVAPHKLNRSDVLILINQAYQKGKIDNDHRILYRVAALKAPHLLPRKWQRVMTEGMKSKGCFTSVMVEAAQNLDRMADAVRRQVQNLLLPPDDLSYTVEITDPYPVIITYDDPAMDNMAQQIRTSFITSFNRLNNDWGWHEPGIEAPLAHYRIFISRTGMGGGAYTAPYEQDMSGWACAAYTYIVVDTNNDSWSIPNTTAHEWNHACQAKMDASEPAAFWENTSTYESTQVFQNSWMYALYSFRLFQDYPWRPLEYMGQPYSDGYEYGGALWVYFLDHYYGNEDPLFIRGIWEDSMQIGCYNEPDYFDVIDTKIQDAGGEGIAEAVKLFAHWRYYVGADDDGQHFPSASMWPEAEVTKLHSWTTVDLPVMDRTPPIGQRPQPNGCNYIEVDVVNNAQMPIRFSFNGEQGIIWNVDVVKSRSGQNTTYETMELDANNAGVMDVDNVQGDRLVMIVCQIGPPDYDPDDELWTAGEYTYDIQFATPPPTVTSINPNKLAPGTQGATVVITGTAFMDDPSLTVTFSGDGKVIAEVQNITATQIVASLIVAGTAELGFRDVIVTNPGGSAGTGPNLLEIVDPSDLPPDGGTGDGTDNGPKPGCDCRTASDGNPGGPYGLPVAFALLSLLFWGLVRSSPRRRR